MGRKVSPILSAFRNIVRCKKAMQETNSILAQTVLQQEIEDLGREIKTLEERVGMTDGTKNNA